MNVVLQSRERTLISFSPEELIGICNALNEICNDRYFNDFEFETRLGVTHQFLSDLLNQMPLEASPSRGTAERADVWAADGAVHMMCINAFGDPVELSDTEAQAFAEQLHLAISEAK